MHILIAEDDPVSRRVLEATLTKWGFDVTSVADGQQAWNILNDPSGPKLAILDWMMPHLSGVDVCRRVRESNLPEYTYLILLTARDRKEDLVEGMNSGADDYLSKPFEASELRVRILAAKRIVELQQQLLTAQQQLRDQAMHDSMTGVFNRGAIIDHLTSELCRTDRRHTPVSAILIDLDHFKQINDTYGHAAGDEVLREAVRRMNSTVRGYDRVGRYGGEEFLVVASECDTQLGIIVADRIREAIASPPVQVGDHQIAVTMSAGVASVDMCDTLPGSDDLIHQADCALYRAKANGRNCVCAADMDTVIAVQ